MREYDGAAAMRQARRVLNGKIVRGQSELTGREVMREGGRS